MNTMKLLEQTVNNERTKKRGQNYPGQVLLIVALMLPVLCGMMGLAIDVGSFYQLKRRMQTAADAGAAAAAQEVKRKSSDSQISQAARSGTASNGFDGSKGDVITVNRPPTSGPNAGNRDFVEVIISQNAPTYFIRVLGINSATVQARAVGGLVNADSACIYALDRTRDRAFRDNGGTVNSSCGVIVDSNSARALSVTGATMTAASIDVVGGYESGGGTINPTPTTGAFPENDPLADVPQPVDSGGCDFTKFEAKDGSWTLSPGVYCGGINIGSSTNVVFNPGIYVLRGGGLNVGSSATVRGTGVGFFNTSGSGYDYAPINFGSSSNARLSAPTSGPLAGFVFFQDRSAPPFLVNVIGCNATSYFEGTIYFPTQHLEFGSNSGTTVNGVAWTLIVVNTLEVGSSASLNFAADFTSGPPRPPIKKPALVE